MASVTAESGKGGARAQCASRAPAFGRMSALARHFGFRRKRFAG